MIDHREDLNNKQENNKIIAFLHAHVKIFTKTYDLSTKDVLIIKGNPL